MNGAGVGIGVTREAIRGFQSNKPVPDGALLRRHVSLVGFSPHQGFCGTFTISEALISKCTYLHNIRPVNATRYQEIAANLGDVGELASHATAAATIAEQQLAARFEAVESPPVPRHRPTGGKVGYEVPLGSVGAGALMRLSDYPLNARVCVLARICLD